MQNHFESTKPVAVNAGLATGPRTQTGKQISSRNALKHGCCSSDTLILRDVEHIEDYKALEAIWFQAYLPGTEAEKHLVQELVNADWFLQRATRTVAAIEAELLETMPNPLEWTEQQNRTLARFLRYQTTRANTVIKCRKAIEDYRKNRAAEKLSQEKQLIAQERHEIYKEKNKPEPSIEEILDKMMAAGKSGQTPQTR
jgi:hypothetical protein